MPNFINPSSIVAQVGLKQGQTVADFGCGAGFYTIASAKLVGDSGHVFAIDVMPDRLEATMSAASHAGLRNITVAKADLEKPLAEPEVGSCDLVIVSSILHIVSNRDSVIHNAFASLKTGGLLLAVEWKIDAVSSFAPKPENRVGRTELDKIMLAKGFKYVRELVSDGDHYAMLYRK